jgi:hypothetical protein
MFGSPHLVVPGEDLNVHNVGVFVVSVDGRGCDDEGITRHLQKFADHPASSEGTGTSLRSSGAFTGIAHLKTLRMSHRNMNAPAAKAPDTMLMIFPPWIQRTMAFANQQIASMTSHAVFVIWTPP